MKGGDNIDEITTTITLAGSDKTKEGAFINAINKLQMQISKEIKGLPIRIEPLNVTLVEGTEIIRTEKFLFFFMKKTVSKFTLKINVKVRATVVDVEKFNFEQVKRKY